jgi:ABC-type multidrug transport system fused ATPase/permease subunit
MILRRITEHVKAQNWFAVALDFAIVVIGVGVAMFGQQWLSDRQQRAEMAAAENALQTDLFANYMNAKERLAIADCRAETYQAIAARLLAAGENWTGIARAADEDTFRAVLPVVFRSPNRNWGSRIWEAELGRGTFNQMTDERRGALDGIFKQAEHAEELQSDIYALQGRLKILAVDTTISQSDRRRYYDMLAEMDDKSGVLELIAEQIIQGIEEIGIEIPAKERPGISEGFASHKKTAKRIYGECYRPQELPVLDADPKEPKTP